MTTYAPDCIVSMNQADVKVTALAARQLSIPYVPSVQNLRFFYGNPIFRSFKKWIYERLMQSATLAICSSNATADEHLDRFGLKHEKLVIIPNSIDCEYTRQRADLSVRSEIRKNLGLADDAILLVNTGRISEQKGHLVLLNALCQTAQFSDNERVHLLVVGSARESDLAHSKKVHDLHDKLKFKERIHFLGWRDDVPDILDACDFYVHSALWEGLPLAVLEAMACGLGILMTDCAGRLPNFVDGQHGWCVAKNDPEALAEGIQQVLKLDEVERAEMGRAARKLAMSHFDIKVNGARFVDEIEKVVSI